MVDTECVTVTEQDCRTASEELCQTVEEMEVTVEIFPLIIAW